MMPCLASTAASASPCQNSSRFHMVMNPPASSSRWEGVTSRSRRKQEVWYSTSHMYRRERRVCSSSGWLRKVSKSRSSYLTGSEDSAKRLRSKAISHPRPGEGGQVSLRQVRAGQQAGRSEERRGGQEAREGGRTAEG